MSGDQALDPIQRVIIDGHPRASAARPLLEERKRLLDESVLWGYIVSGTAVVLAIVMAVAENATLSGGLGYFAAFWNRVGASFNIAQPRFVLLLRRFRPSAKRKDFILAKIMGDACRGLAIPATIQDRSFRGELPIFSQVVRQMLLIPAAGLGTVGIGLMLPQRFYMRIAESVVVGLFIGICGTLYLFFYLLLRWAAVKRASENNYLSMLERFVTRIRARRHWTYSGTRVMKFPDKVWRDGIDFCLRNADAVVIDLTDVSENVEWEIATAFRLVGPEKIMLTWTVDNSEGDRTKLPQWLSERLLKIVPDATFSDCRVRAYTKRNEGGEGFLYEKVFAADLALCIGGRRPESQK
jgi:hypothetical protein